MRQRVFGSKIFACGTSQRLTVSKDTAQWMRERDCGAPVSAGSTLSFDQARVGNCMVRLRFTRARPPWVRVYELGNSRRPRFLKNLLPAGDDREAREYRDVAENVPATSARVYMFKVDTI